MEIIVITGLKKHINEINKTIDDLSNKGYIFIENFAKHDDHPIDIINITKIHFEALCRNINNKYLMYTNSDHIINYLRVLKRQSKIEKYEVIHFGLNGKEIIECDVDGEFNKYPDNFLSMWTCLLGQLL